MLQRVLRLRDRSVKSLITPCKEICWLDLEHPFDENLAELMERRHSCCPVARCTLDECLGIVSIHSLFAVKMISNTVEICDHLRPPLHVAESTKALSDLDQFKQAGVQIALVTDEFEGVEGLVTLNDLMEAMVGELPKAEADEAPPITRATAARG